jgi:molybdate transport system substrate-binding protein
VKRIFQTILIGLLIVFINSSFAVELKVFSGGPFEAAFHELAKDFEASTGNRLVIEYGTAPQLQQKLTENVPGDLMLTATNLMTRPENQVKLVDGTMALLGKGGVGIMVKKGNALATMNTPEAFRNAVLQADRLIYNKASTGLYIDQLFKKIGLAEKLESKTERFVNGDDAIQRVIRGSGNEIGFGAIAEIKLNESKGVVLSGPLPDEYQNYTNYSGAVMKTSKHPKETQQLIEYLQSDKSKALFKRTGID